MTGDDEAELALLIDRHAAGEADEADVARLRALVGDDRDLARQVAGQVILAVRLRAVERPTDAALPARLRSLRQNDTMSRRWRTVQAVRRGLGRRRRTNAMPWPLLAAAAALAALLVVAVLPLGRTADGDTPLTVLARSEAVAELLPAPTAEVLVDGKPVSGDRQELLPGARIAIRQGAAAIGYPDGSDIALVAGSQVLMPATGARLHLESGSCQATVTPGSAVPFALTTDEAEIVVLGTRFHVDARTGTTAVAVDRGRVAVRSRAGGDELTLAAGGRAEVQRGRAPERSQVTTRTVRIPVLADSHIWEQEADARKGDDEVLAFKFPPADADGGRRFERRVLLRFPIEPAPSPVRRAILELHVLQAERGTRVAVRTVSGTWDEATVSWGTQPALGAAIATATIPRAPGICRIDVTSALAGHAGRILDLALVGVVEKQVFVKFASREHADAALRPVLVVETAP